MVFLKYKPSYKVTIAGEEIGYVANKQKFEKVVKEQILYPEQENIAFVDIEEMPQYEFFFLDNTEPTLEEEVFTKIQDMAVITYKIYAITLNNQITTYVNSKEEAEEIINQMKEEKAEELKDITIAMQEVYTKEKEKTQSTVEVATAMQVAEVELEKQVEEQEKVKASTLDGVYFSVKPVTGNITSRFGAMESIRDHAHTGMDIAAPNGTPIKAAAEGTVTHAGWLGGYGNLVIISHGNGIQTYYGHCSKLYVSKGDTIKAGDVIAAVGSTGEATGNHLHFEIRKNGAQVNPQKYIYK